MIEDERELDEEISAEEEEELKELLNSYKSPTGEAKHSFSAFLNRIANSKDTTKTGNLTKEEVGFVTLPVRSLKEYSLIAENLCEDDVMSKHFEKESEILTATSLSKEGFLIKQGNRQTRTFEETAKIGRNVTSNKGWFSRGKTTAPDNN